MTEKQKQAILEVCRNLISTGIAFGYQRERTEPEYPAERGLTEIVRILETGTSASAKTRREAAKAIRSDMYGEDLG